MTTLAYYEAQLRDLLHDPNDQFWSLTQKDNYINQARRQLVIDTGCLRSLQTSYCSYGTEAYAFGQVGGALILSGGSNYTAPTINFTGGGGSGVAAILGVTGGAVTSITFTNFGSGYTSAPSYTISDSTGGGATLAVGVVNVNTYDIIDLKAIQGSDRYSLMWRPFSEFSAMLRPLTNYYGQPGMWAVFGENQYFLGPLPDQTYQLEIDSVVLPTALTDYVTNDPIPTLRQDVVQFYAAYMAKFNDQSFGEAAVFRKQYDMKLQETGGAYVRRIPNIYDGIDFKKG